MHDRIYKSAINVTEDWKENRTPGALLEEADNAFSEYPIPSTSWQPTTRPLPILKNLKRN
jgi:hypothetical protein